MSANDSADRRAIRTYQAVSDLRARLLGELNELPLDILSAIAGDLESTVQRCRQALEQRTTTTERRPVAQGDERLWRRP